MWKIEVIQRRRSRILVFYKEDGVEEHDSTRGSLEVYDDTEYEKCLKALEVLNNNN